jgi:hypothetical protein
MLPEFGLVCPAKALGSWHASSFSQTFYADERLYHVTYQIDGFFREMLRF